MKTKTVGLFILVAMGILFCAGPVDAAEADFTVLLIGDCAGEHSPELPALLQQSLKAEGFNAQVSVAGKPGATSAEALDALEKSVLRQPPDLVVAQFGLHEAPGAAKPNRDNARPNPLQFRSNLDKLVRQLRGAGIDVILMTPNPVFWTDAARKIWSPPPFQPQEAWGRNVFLEEHAKTLRWVGLKHSLPIVDVYQRCVNHEALNGPPPADWFEEGVRPNAATQAKIADWLCDQILLDYLPAGTRREMPRGYSIPLVDLAQQTQRQVTVDREDGQYLGHPSTVLLEDGKTLLCVYPKGHGRGAIVMKRSGDGGLTWSERLPVPENWATSQEVPVLYPATGPEGKRRLLLFSGLYPIRMSLSEDNGASWSPLSPIGDFGGIVAFASMARRKNGDYVGFFHDDGRFLRSVDLKSNPPVFTVYQSVSQDGCLTWAQPQEVVSRSRAALCEPGLVVSPDGARWALLLRENLRRHNSFIVFSEDEGQTWSRPRELPASLTGDRHTARYAPDGRLFVSFRDMAKESPTRGDWAGWVGAWDDLVSGTEGQYRVRLMKNHLNENGREGDCAYPGVELLPDGTFVCTTYGHWTEGAQPWVASVRFRLEELDILRQTMK